MLVRSGPQPGIIASMQWLKRQFTMPWTAFLWRRYRAGKSRIVRTSRRAMPGTLSHRVIAGGVPARRAQRLLVTETSTLASPTGPAPASHLGAERSVSQALLRQMLTHRATARADNVGTESVVRTLGDGQ